MSNKANKILILTTAYKPFIGGSELAIESVTRYLPNIFFEVVTPKYKSSLKSIQKDNNVTINRIGFGTMIDKYIFPLTGFIRSLRIIKRNDIKIVHAYQASFGAMAGYLLKLFRRDIKFIVTLQEGEKLDKQFFLKRVIRIMILKRADIITAISNYLGEYARRVSRRSNIFIIPNGVEVTKAKVDTTTIKRKLKIKKEQFVIITTSRLVAKNGIEDLVKAFNILVTKYNADVKLVIVGDGPLMKKLVLMVNDFRLKNGVTFTGWIDNYQVTDLLLVSDVFVRPSYSEGLGNSFLEAMLNNVVIVGTNVGGIPDFLEDNKTGLMVKVGDIDDIAEKINRLLGDEKLRERLTIGARKIIEKNYMWEKIANQYKNVYESR